MDDTILADGQVSPKSWEQAFARFAPLLGGFDVQELAGALNDIRRQLLEDPEWNRWSGLNLAASRRELVAMTLSHLGMNAGQTANEIAEAYAEIKEASLEVFPGAIGTLKHIREMGKGMALITNGLSRAQRCKIDRFGLGPLFDCIIIEEEFGVGKPDAKVFLARIGAVGSSALGGRDDRRQSAHRHRRRPVPRHLRDMG